MSEQAAASSVDDELTLRSVIQGLASASGIRLADVDYHRNAATPGSLSFTLVRVRGRHKQDSNVSLSAEHDTYLDSYITEVTVEDLEWAIWQSVNTRTEYVLNKYRGSYWACDSVYWPPGDSPGRWEITLMPTEPYEDMMKDRLDQSQASLEDNTEDLPVEDSIIPF